MLSWAWRHRKKIAVTAVMGGATAYGAYYLYRKKRELDELMEKFGLQQLLSGGTSNGGRSSCEERVREHFADMQREADRLLTDALPKLQEQIAMLLDTDELQERLRADGPSAEPSGWHELKVLVISRLLTAQYALVLTMLAVRIRLNIIGRHYLLEAQATAEGTRLESALTRLTKKRFLSTENLLGDGLRPLQRGVTACVRAHLQREVNEDVTKESYFTDICTTKVSGEEAMALLEPMRDELERGQTADNGGDPAADAAHDSLLRSFLLEEQVRAHGTVADGDQLHELLAEVRSVVSSAAFRIVLDDLLGATFANVAEQLSHAADSHASSGVHGAAGLAKASVSLTRVKLLAKFKHLATATLAGIEPYTARMLEVPSLDEFSWMVYSGD